MKKKVKMHRMGSKAWRKDLDALRAEILAKRPEQLALRARLLARVLALVKP